MKHLQIYLIGYRVIEYVYFYRRLSWILWSDRYIISYCYCCSINM